MVDKSPEQLAKEHAEWFTEVFQTLMKKVFYEAFIHGYKHGRRENNCTVENVEKRKST